MILKGISFGLKDAVETLTETIKNAMNQDNMGLCIQLLPLISHLTIF